MQTEFLQSTEINQINNEADQTELFQNSVDQTEQFHLSTNVSHEETFMDQNSTNNKIVISQLNTETDTTQILSSTTSNFHLTNEQLLTTDAVNFLNAPDPLKCEWSDFEKNPIKSLLLW